MKMKKISRKVYWSLKKKSIRSKFNPKVVKSLFEKITEYNSNESSKKLKNQKSESIYWSSQLITLLRFTKEENKLFSFAKTSLTKQRSIGWLLNTFSCIAKKESNVLLNNNKKCKNWEVMQL